MLNVLKLLSRSRFTLTCLIFVIYLSIAGAYNTTQAAAGTSGIVSCFADSVTGLAYSNTLDARCKCPRNYCRLSDIKGSDENLKDSGRLDNYTKLGQPEFRCYEAGTRLGVNSGEDAKSFRDTGQNNPDELKGLAFYLDEFNRNPSAQNIPEGAVCRVLDRNGNPVSNSSSISPDDAYAYWFFDDYFKGVTGATMGEKGCEPILTKTDIFGNPTYGTDTFFGCLPNSFNGVITFFVRLAVGLGGGITFLIVLINLVKIIGSSNNPDVITESRKKLSAALFTFIGLLASLTLLNILGLQILDLDSFGGGLLRIFTGG